MGSDVKISELVKRVLTRHWIDQTDLRFTSTRGTIRFHGTLRHLSNAGSIPINEPLLETVTQEIQRIPGVNRVYFTGVQIDEPWADAEAIEEEEL